MAMFLGRRCRGVGVPYWHLVVVSDGKTAVGGLADSWRVDASRLLLKPAFWVAKDLSRIRQASARTLIAIAKANPPLKELDAMFTSGFNKPAVRTAVAGGMLGLAALLVAGTANAEGADDQFLGALQQQGIGFGNTQPAITVAHHVCDALGQGMEPSDISNNIAGANSRIDQHTALVIVVDAAQSYCPQYVHQMANGATVIGPDHQQA
jgi:hypothetical protein